MKTASEIFLTVGVPIGGSTRFRGFRAFNERDIAKMQRDAFEAGWEAGFQEALEPDRYPDRDRCADALKDATTSPVTDNPQEDAFCKKVDP